MNPEMSTPIWPLLAAAGIVWLALSLVVAIGWHMSKQATRRASYRTSNRAGRNR